MNPHKSLINSVFLTSCLIDYLNGVFYVDDPKLAGVGGCAFIKTTFKIKVNPIRTPCKIYIPKSCFLVYYFVPF